MRAGLTYTVLGSAYAKSVSSRAMLVWLSTIWRAMNWSTGLS